MINKKKSALALAVAISIFGVGNVSFADDDKKAWSAQTELSFVNTTGNSDSQNLALKNSLKYDLTQKIKLDWKLSIIRGESDGELSSESYATSLRGDYSYSKSLFLFITTGWEKDEFAGTESKISVGPGLGYKIIDGPKHSLSTEAGVNYVQEQFTDDTDNSFANGRLFTEYGYQFNKKSKFTQSVEYLHDFDNTDNFNVNSETAVTTAFNDIFSLKIGYTVKYDNEPLTSSFDKTDTVLNATVIANY
ncbi:MAG: DUF481 domain-containing protein [Magnetococcales bacterium]|nr:DUF481 domain-containing protein [Magnetococcales bacterium]